MYTATSLSPFGLFHRELFLPAPECAETIGEMRSSRGEQASVYLGRGGGYEVDEQVRRSRSVSIEGEIQARVEQRLRGLLPALSSHFGEELSDLEPPTFLEYQPGDHFVAHRDSSSDTDAPERARVRRVTVVLFLNRWSERPVVDGYGGGKLILCLFDDPRAQRVGFDLVGTTGLLIAFRSTVLHEVTPVEHGHRYTVVTWCR